MLCGETGRGNPVGATRPVAIYWTVRRSCPALDQVDCPETATLRSALEVPRCPAVTVGYRSFTPIDCIWSTLPLLARRGSCHAMASFDYSAGETGSHERLRG